MEIKYELERTPLEIKTDSATGSNDEVRVSFWSDDKPAASVWIKLSSTPQWWIGYCNGYWKRFPDSGKLPTTADKVWRITKTRPSAGIRVQIHCNQVEVLNKVLSHSTCEHGGFGGYWNRVVTRIKFFDPDTASDFYKAIPGKTCSLEE